MNLPAMGLILWRTPLGVFPFALVVGLLVAWGILVHRNLLSRHTPRKALLLLVPRLVVVLLLVVALLDPVATRRVVVRTADTVLVALDISSSMEVRDTGTASRRECAHAVLQKIKEGLPQGFKVKAIEFDTDIHEPGAAPSTGLRNTDLGAVLLSLARGVERASIAGIVMVTDGGDEPVGNVELPGVPLSIVGVGSDLSHARDLAIAEVRFPPAIEKGAALEFHVEVSARNPQAFTGLDLRHLPLVLERGENGLWKPESEQRVDLSAGQAEAVFKVTCGAVGLCSFRLTLKEQPGELTGLNNSRTLTVEVRQNSLHVLFFARELGLDLKMLRGELARDAGVTFTALFRTMGERFTIQGERVPGDESLESGFPSEAARLKPFDVVIIGSVPPRDWQERQMAALRTYVEQGGAVVFLGDEAAFGPAGYAASALAPLLPWEAPAPGYTMLHGEFAAGIAPVATSHAVVTGLGPLFEEGAPTVESVLPVGPLKPGALSLMTVVADRRAVPLVAVQRFGRGSVMALTSNTLWKWARHSEAWHTIYGMFWRQAVRSLAPAAEGGRVLSVRWDRDHYKPGEKAVAEIRTVSQESGGGPALTASLSRDRETRSLPVEPLQGQPGVYTARMVFEKRGSYHFQLVANQGTAVLETYDRILPVAPLLGEGAKLELDGRALSSLARRGGGSYVEEQEAGRVATELAKASAAGTLASEVSLLSDSPLFALLLMGVLAYEWVMRRRMNLF